MKKIKITILLLIISLCFLAVTFAETIVLKSGKSIEGKIIEDTDNYIKIETINGQFLYYYKNTIDTIKSNNEGLNLPLVKPSPKSGLLDYSDKGYMLFVPKDVLSSSPILICLPGSEIRTKQDINNWAFKAGKNGFIVLGLDVDYKSINSLSDVEALYSKISAIVYLLTQEYHLNKDKLYLVGTSAGGMMSIALTLHYPKKFLATGVVSGGRLGFGSQKELRNAKGINFYMVHGERDESIPLGEFQSTRKQLEKNGAIIEHNVIVGGRHTLNSSSYKEVIDWLSDFDSLLNR